MSIKFIFSAITVTCALYSTPALASELTGLTKSFTCPDLKPDTLYLNRQLVDKWRILTIGRSPNSGKLGEISSFKTPQGFKWDKAFASVIFDRSGTVHELTCQRGSVGDVILVSLSIPASKEVNNKNFTCKVRGLNSFACPVKWLK